MREPTAWILAFLAGWGILRVLALVPVLGGLVGFAAVAFGLGALLVAIWRARTTSVRGAGNRLTCPRSKRGTARPAGTGTGHVRRIPPG